MDNLLFYSLLTAIAYYFLVHTKPNRPDPATEPKLTHSRSTQTDSIITKRTEYEPGPEDTLNCPGAIKFPSDQVMSNPQAIQELEREKQALLKDQKQKEDEISAKQRTIQGLNSSYTKLEEKKNQQITNLNQQITTLKSQLTSLQQTQTSDQKELEKTLDTLIKGMTDLEKEL